GVQNLAQQTAKLSSMQRFEFMHCSAKKARCWIGLSRCGRHWPKMARLCQKPTRFARTSPTSTAKLMRCERKSSRQRKEERLPARNACANTPTSYTERFSVTKENRAGTRLHTSIRSNANWGM